MSWKRISFALLAAVLPLLAGCTRHSKSEQYYLIATDTAVPYWKTAADGFAAAGAQYGVSVDTRGPAGLNPQNEVEEFRAMVARKPAGILVSVANAKLMTPEIDAAIAAGIPVITVDSDAPESKRLYFIGTNNLEAGRLGGRRMAAKLNGKGNVVFFTNPGQPNLDERLKGYEEIFAAFPGIKVVEVFDIKADPGSALDQAGVYLARTGAAKVDGFICLDSRSGSNVAEAFKRRNATDRLLIAMDTDIDTLRLVGDGTIDSTISQKPYTMAFLGLKALDDIHHYPVKPLGADFGLDPYSPFPAFIDTGVALVDKTNLDPILKKEVAANKYSSSKVSKDASPKTRKLPFLASLRGRGASPHHQQKLNTRCRVRKLIVGAVFVVTAVGCIGVPAMAGQTAITYQKPPAPIEQLLEAPTTPVVLLSPDRKMMLVEQPATFPTIADVAQPRYRLAGIRFNPSSNGPSVERYDVALQLWAVDAAAAKTITGLPAKLKAVDAMWSPDSKHAAFVAHATAPATGLELWVIDVATAHARRVGAVKLNAVLGSPCQWLPDSASLLCKTVPANRGAAPKVSDIPAGPDVEESLGKVSPAPTYEDMLKTTTDENIFEYYASSELAVVSLSGAVKPLAAKGLIERAAPSPDGQYALVAIVHRPFNYTFPYERFPLKTEVVPVKSASAVKLLSDRGAVDNLPISRDAVEPGPRDYQWRADVPATVVWVEAADGGDPTKHAAIVDKVLALPAPFSGSASTILELPMRLARGFGQGAARGIEWGNDHLAIVSVARFSDRKSMMLAFDPSTGTTKTIYSGSSQDRYHNPGRPMTAMNASGQMVLKLTADGTGVYFISPGASPKGDQPFVGVMPVGGGEEKILYRSSDPYYDEPVALLSDSTVMIRRESQTMSPNYFSAPLSGGEPVQLTHFPGRYDNIKMPTRQFLKYKRADGVDLTATLWLPAGYDKSQGPLPTLMEAYPAEFKTRSAASQVSGSPNRYPVFGGGSHLYLVQAGYAILDSATIPIIGEEKQEPNDTYVEQLVAGAKAAVDYGASLGVVDPKRVAVMGHSYGAFMTANLLAHTEMFRAGIAESGAYNRSLTPYGFQNEERTYWQDPKLYFDMSPFSYADKIKTPILLIHGEADDNTGTYPIQSERFYAALKGQGATVRLVFLPLEPHAYGALETKQHVLWEIDRWMDTYVKPERPVVGANSSTGN